MYVKLLPETFSLSYASQFRRDPLTINFIELPVTAVFQNPAIQRG